jgi:nucleoside-diphosphate-sugar epimerase
VPGVRHLSVDLTDQEACERAFGSLADVTHLVYAALYEIPGLMPGWLDDRVIERNGEMLRNLFEPLSRVATGLRHVTLLHGTKAYGGHHPSVGLANIRIPLRERDPRRPHPNFYFVQEEYLREKQARRDWKVTVFRPTVIYGAATGNNMNPLPVIGAYAAILKAAGEPLHFPGAGDEESLREGVDASLLADAITWAAEAPAAAGETFNVTNGDVFIWQNIWPTIAATLGMEPGEHRPVSLQEELPRRAGEWTAIVKEYGLAAPADLLEFAGHNSIVYTDMVLNRSRRLPIPMLNSTIKLRQAGFHECLDSEDMFRDLFQRLQADRLLPPP